MNGHFGYCVRIMYMQIYIWENEHVNSVCILIFTTFEQPYSYAVISWWISCCTIWKVVEINSTMKYRWNVKLFRGNLNCSVEIQAALSFPMVKLSSLYHIKSRGNKKSALRFRAQEIFILYRKLSAPQHKQTSRGAKHFLCRRQHTVRFSQIYWNQLYDEF